MAKKRQVVFIMTDTTRWDMLGCYGNSAMKTPNLDAMARRGVRYERAYTCQPVCGPARSAIFTGLYPHTNGSWTNSVSLYGDIKTLGQRLNDAGISTGYIGKWHLDGGDYFGCGVCPDGWDPDYWYDMRCYLEELSEEERSASRRTQLMEERPVKEEFTFGHRCTNRALDFLEWYANEEFLLVLSYDEPHGPFLCPEPFASMYKEYDFPKSSNVWDTLEGKPPHQKVWAGKETQTDRDALTIRAQYYLGCNSFVDYEIGRVLRQIEAYTPDALVIFTSDHGDFLGSHCLNGKGPAAYDEITRIPLIIQGGEEGAVRRSPVSHIDLTPTILDYMGLPVPKTLPGKTLVPTFTQGEEPVGPVFMEFGRYEVDHDGFGGFQPMRAVFDGRYKLVVNLLSTDEFYDLEKDPAENHNLIDAEETRGVRNALHDRLLDWMNDTRDPFRGYYWERRPWRQDARPATWHYTGYTRQRENEPGEKRQLDYDTGLPMVDAVRKKRV